jgi:Right handed beta helix region
VNRYAFTGFAKNVTISYLTIQNFGTKASNNGEGVVNHDSAVGWRILHDTIRRNGGAGVFLGSHGQVRNNCLTHNGEYGFQALDSRHSVLAHNEITGNNTANWEIRRPGCGCTGGGKFWTARNVTVRDNFVHDNRGVGLWADTNNAGLLFTGNWIADNDDEGLLYEISYNARIIHNTFVGNGWVKGPTNPGFPTGAIYVSESGSDPRVKTRFRRSFRITHNRFVDNWAGVVGWENADRFAGSPNNSSTGFSTLVNRKVANLRTCVAGTISRKPYFDDCRWKTKRLRVAHNTFVSHSSVIPGCREDTGCGFQGLFSNWGTSPDWSPYQGRVVERNITWHQGNRWRDNRYVGAWHFMVMDQATVVPWHRWRARYGQDRESMRN